MAKKIKKNKLVNKLVHLIELADLAEFEDSDVGLGDYHRGSAHGLRAALALVSSKAVPAYAIIKRNSYEFEPYEESGAAPEFALEYCE